MSKSRVIKRLGSFVSRILLLLIRFYQVFLSPLCPGCCRYYPTCSQYAFESIKKHGPAKGSYLAVKRILRCNPFSKGGIDPVP